MNGKDWKSDRYAYKNPFFLFKIFSYYRRNDHILHGHQQFITDSSGRDIVVSVQQNRHMFKQLDSARWWTASVRIGITQLVGKENIEINTKTIGKRPLSPYQSFNPKQYVGREEGHLVQRGETIFQNGTDTIPRDNEQLTAKGMRIGNGWDELQKREQEIDLGVSGRILDRTHLFRQRITAKDVQFTNVVQSYAVHIQRPFSGKLQDDGEPFV